MAKNGKNFAKSLKKIIESNVGRGKKFHNRTDIAKKSGISQPYLSQITKNKVHMIDSEVLHSLNDNLGLPKYYLTNLWAYGHGYIACVPMPKKIVERRDEIIDKNIFKTEIVTSLVEGIRFFLTQFGSKYGLVELDTLNSILNQEFHKNYLFRQIKVNPEDPLHDLFIEQQSVDEYFDKITKLEESSRSETTELFIQYLSKLLSAETQINDTEINEFLTTNWESGVKGSKHGATKTSARTLDQQGIINNFDKLNGLGKTEFRAAIKHYCNQEVYTSNSIQIFNEDGEMQFK